VEFQSLSFPLAQLIAREYTLLTTRGNAYLPGKVIQGYIKCVRADILEYVLASPAGLDDKQINLSFRPTETLLQKLQLISALHNCLHCNYSVHLDGFAFHGKQAPSLSFKVFLFFTL